MKLHVNQSVSVYVSNCMIFSHHPFRHFVNGGCCNWNILNLIHYDSYFSSKSSFYFLYSWWLEASVIGYVLYVRMLKGQKIQMKKIAQICHSVWTFKIFFNRNAVVIDKEVVYMTEEQICRRKRCCRWEMFIFFLRHSSNESSILHRSFLRSLEVWITVDL